MAFHALSKNTMVFVESSPNCSLRNLKIRSYVLKRICEMISLKVSLIQSFFERISKKIYPNNITFKRVLDVASM